MTERSVDWAYNLVDTTEDKTGRRASTPMGLSRELIGVDGSLQGGLRPFQGYLFVTELNNGFADTAGAVNNGHLTDMFGITFRLDETSYASGFLWRVRNDAGSKAKYRFSIRLGSDPVWITEGDYGAGYLADGILQAEEDYAGEQMSVTEVGKFVYVWRSGLPAFMFYLESDGIGGWDLVVVTPIGPGLQPELEAPTPNGFGMRSRAGGQHPDMDDVLTEMADPAADRHARGRVVYPGFSDLRRVSLDGINFVNNPNITVRNTAGGPHVDEAVRGPDDLMDENGADYWATPPQPDPVFREGVPPAGVPTVYPAPPSPTTEWFGWRYDESSPPESPRGIPSQAAGQAWIYAYQMYDSRTGRFSALSNKIQSAPDQYGTPAITGIFQPAAFPLFEIIYDSDRFDTCFLFRGTLQGGVSVDQIVLSLERVIDPELYLLDTQPIAPLKRASYFTTLTDGAMTLQPKYKAGDVHFEETPRAGAAYFYEGVMLLGNTGRLLLDIGGLGVVYFSDMSRVAVEMVPPANRYALQVPTEEVLRFVQIGPNVVGLTNSSLYMFRRYNTDLQMFPLQAKYDIVAPKAASTLGSKAYFVSQSGLKVLDSNGNLASIDALNHIMVNEWAAAIDQTSMAYDPLMELLVIFNSTLERCAMMWFRTQRLTEVYDCPFVHVFEGQVPFTESEGGSPLKQRAVFVQEIPEVGSNGARWRIYVIDHDRRKGNQRLLDPTGDVRFSIVEAPGGTTVTLQHGTIGTRLNGCYMYVLDGPHAGEKFKIYTTAGNIVTLLSATPALEMGTRVGISPVFMRWVGYQTGIVDDTGQLTATRDMFRLRQVESASCAFEDVSGDAAPDVTYSDARFSASVYKGNADDPLEGGVFPISPAGRGEKMISVANGPSQIPAYFGEGNHGLTGSALFPSVEVYCPDLDYTLLSVTVVGKLLGSVREDRPITRRPG